MDAAAQKVELLAPAGNPEKLEMAIHYGADAVYLAGKRVRPAADS
jgi:putative protease